MDSQAELQTPDALEWPPPGLDSIHRRIRHVSTRGWTASLLLCPLVVWLMLDAPGLDPQRGGVSLIAIAALVGVLAFLSALTGAASLVDQARRARRLGYSTEVIMDVLTDTDGRAAAAWFGTGAMNDVRPITRERTRALRRAATLLVAVAAVLPPILLASGLLLSLRGAASLTAVLSVAFLPSLLALITASICRGYALLLVQWDRGSAQWDPAPVTVEERARAWVTRMQPRTHARPPGMGQLALVAVAAIGAIGVFLFTAATTAGAIAAGVTTRAVGPSLLSSGVSAGATLGIELARRERLPVDSSIDPQTAGIAIHEALSAGEPLSWPRMNNVAPHVDVPWRQPLTPGSRAVTDVWEGVFTGNVDPAVLADTAHPAVEQLFAAARAPAADLLAGRWQPEAPLWGLLGWGGRSNSSRRQRVIVFYAARAARQGNYARAEELLRSLISFGVLLADDGPATGDYSTGANMAANGYRMLGRMRALRGDSTLLRIASTMDDALYGIYAGARTERNRPGLRRAVSRAPYASQRWHAAATLALAERCGSFRGLLFGPPPPPPNYLEGAQRALVRYPSEQRLFDLLQRPDLHTESQAELPMPRRWVGTRIIRAVLGPQHQRSVCYAIGRIL